MGNVILKGEGAEYSVIDEYRFETRKEASLSAKSRVITKTPIFFASVEITDICNLDCSYCFIDINSKRVIPDHFNRLAALIRELHREHGLMRMSITGGEPFASKNLFDFLDLTRELDIDVRIHSNGLLIRDAMIPRLGGYSNLNEIEISIDHPRDDSSLYSRKRNTIPQRLSVIGRLRKAGVNAIVSTVLTHDLVENLMEMRDVLAAAGVKTWRLREQLLDIRTTNSFCPHNMMIHRLLELNKNTRGMYVYGHLYDTICSGLIENKCKYTENRFVFVKYNGDVQWMCGVNLFAGSYFETPLDTIAKRIQELNGEYPVPGRCKFCAGKFVCVTSPYSSFNPQVQPSIKSSLLSSTHE